MHLSLTFKYCKPPCSYNCVQYKIIRFNTLLHFYCFVVYNLCNNIIYVCSLYHFVRVCFERQERRKMAKIPTICSLSLPSNSIIWFIVPSRYYTRKGAITFIRVYIGVYYLCWPCCTAVVFLDIVYSIVMPVHMHYVRIFMYRPFKNKAVEARRTPAVVIIHPWA